LLLPAALLSHPLTADSRSPARGARIPGPHLGAEPLPYRMRSPPLKRSTASRLARPDSFRGLGARSVTSGVSVTKRRGTSPQSRQISPNPECPRPTAPRFEVAATLPVSRAGIRIARVANRFTGNELVPKLECGKGYGLALGNARGASACLPSGCPRIAPRANERWLLVSQSTSRLVRPTGRRNHESRS
jgi:hypothetical protein